MIAVAAGKVFSNAMEMRGDSGRAKDSGRTIRSEQVDVLFRDVTA